MSDEKPKGWWSEASSKAAGFDPKSAPAYQEGEQQAKVKRSLYEDYTPPVRTHDEKVRRLLTAIAVFTGIVAAATVANFIASIAIGLAAATQ